MCYVSFLAPPGPTPQDSMAETAGFRKKVWPSLCRCLADHWEVMVRIPKILDAYVGPNAIKAQLNESIMVTVNSVNDCAYCTGLHGELARMAGVQEADELMKAKSAQQCRKICDSPAISFARTFTENDGRGEKCIAAFEELSEQMGKGPAGSVLALCWFLLWGSINGNTINSLLLGRCCCAPKEGGSVIVELFTFIYYGPLFLLIAIVNKMLTLFPQVPGWFSAGFGVLLTFIAAVWILPLGLIGCMTKPCQPLYATPIEEYFMDGDDPDE